MKTLMKVGIAAVITAVLLGGLSATGFAQCPCILVCPAGDGGPVGGGPFGGTKSPDLNSDGIVNLVDLAAFAAAWPPLPYLFCADYNCDGIINLVDLANFAAHWLHAGTMPGYNAPGIDHYKVYETAGPSVPGPFWLRDQFGEVLADQLRLAKFATPVSKNDEPICDPRAHQSWWELFYPAPMRMIEAQDQFGTHEWILGEPRYLVLPALKNEGVGTPLPELNHYLCYEAQGPSLGIEVLLVDQFDQSIVIVLDGVYFCNPCEKQTPDGMVYPIIDPYAHLTVYFVENPNPYQIQALMQDQFILEEISLFENLYLAVPALKTQVIEPGSPEWNRIKALYDADTRGME